MLEGVFQTPMDLFRIHGNNKTVQSGRCSFYIVLGVCVRALFNVFQSLAAQFN